MRRTSVQASAGTVSSSPARGRRRHGGSRGAAWGASWDLSEKRLDQVRRRSSKAGAATFEASLSVLLGEVAECRAAARGPFGFRHLRLRAPGLHAIVEVLLGHRHGFLEVPAGWPRLRSSASARRRNLRRARARRHRGLCLAPTERGPTRLPSLGVTASSSGSPASRRRSARDRSRHWSGRWCFPRRRPRRKKPSAVKAAARTSACEAVEVCMERTRSLVAGHAGCEAPCVSATLGE